MIDQQYEEKGAVMVALFFCPKLLYILNYWTVKNFFSGDWHKGKGFGYGRKYFQCG